MIAIGLPEATLWMLIAALHVTRAQDMFDAGDDGGGGEDLSDVLDPNLVMGEDGSSLSHGLGLSANEMSQLETLKMQTLFALQELGIVLGVAFMFVLISWICYSPIHLRICLPASLTGSPSSSSSSSSWRRSF